MKLRNLCKALYVETRRLYSNMYSFFFFFCKKLTQSKCILKGEYEGGR